MGRVRLPRETNGFEAHTEYWFGRGVNAVVCKIFGNNEGENN